MDLDSFLGDASTQENPFLNKYAFSSKRNIVDILNHPQYNMSAGSMCNTETELTSSI